MRTIVVISDTQLPYHHSKALNAVTRFIGETNPSEVIQIGDLMDFPQPSRWNKGTKGEFEGSVLKDAERGKEWLADLRDLYDGPMTVLEGNHDLRPRVYLDKNAPALAESHAFDLDVLLDFDGFGIQLVKDYYDFAPGWTATHGHLGTLSRIPGSTAMGQARATGKSVVCGHTHRLGLQHQTTGYKGRTESRWGFEVGHLMDLKKASYLKSGAANWAMGFGVFHIDGHKVIPTPIPVRNDGSFIYAGETYK
ncbi:metallophosphoesterase [Streptomyces sp. 769]|uniref:metallophosphoesterase family protein n=1 Tax=Streptomyces sp. 769 TaxID=1262452 RepID=UPI00057E27BA|nr:metallophosphoesterase [Streptomyces sp. 769]AJC53970.1 gp51 [Streptomyces sp. 769]